MPHIAAHVHTSVEPSFRTHQVEGIFDLQSEPQSSESFAVDVPGLDEPWTIGAIVGPSGSGKSTVARQAFGDAVLRGYDWPRGRAVIDALGDHSIKQLMRTLSAVGFNSPRAWLRPYRALSNGERFRCELARALLSDAPLVVCDEFTSTVDRTVAKVASAAIAKALRRGDANKRFVAVTCHDDVLAWLEADWVVDMTTGALTWGRLRRPSIELRVVRAPQASWQWFARHHYLSGELSRGATCYVALWNEAPVAFCGVVGALGKRKHKRVTRLVTLPDYQGLGIGTRLLEYVGDRVLEASERYSITTSHPSLRAYLQQSQRWLRKRTRRSFRPSRQTMRDAEVRDSYGRVVTSFEYLG